MLRRYFPGFWCVRLDLCRISFRHRLPQKSSSYGSMQALTVCWRGSGREDMRRGGTKRAWPICPFPYRVSVRRRAKLRTCEVLSCRSVPGFTRVALLDSLCETPGSPLEE